MPLHSRRKFLSLALGLGGLGGVSALGLVAGRRNRTEGQVGLKSASRTSRALGTEVSLLVLHESEKTAQAALTAAYAEIELVEEVMSLYRPQSQLCQLNRQGFLNHPHPYLVTVLEAAQAMAHRSNGAFDVTVQPLWELYAAAQARGKLPEADALEATRRKVNWRKLDVSSTSVRFAETGMAVTLNGIAQGFAADQALSALRAQGISQALVNAGELGAMGHKADDAPWTIGIQHPRRPADFLAVAPLEGLCLSTSGDYETAFTPDFLYNHIFDPATGRSPLYFSSVSVVAKTGMEADALSTAFFVAGPENGLRLLSTTPQAEALFVTKQGQISATPGFPKI